MGNLIRGLLTAAVFQIVVVGVLVLFAVKPSMAAPGSSVELVVNANVENCLVQQDSMMCKLPSTEVSKVKVELLDDPMSDYSEGEWVHKITVDKGVIFTMTINVRKFKDGGIRFKATIDNSSNPLSPAHIYISADSVEKLNPSSFFGDSVRIGDHEYHPIVSFRP